MTDDERKELARRPPWVGARIIDRGAPYVIVGGYHSSEEKAIEAGEAPYFWAACVHRHGVYPLRWAEETRSGRGYTLVEHPTLDLWDADTRHNFLRRYPGVDVTFWETE